MSKLYPRPHIFKKEGKWWCTITLFVFSGSTPSEAYNICMNYRKRWLTAVGEGREL